MYVLGIDAGTTGVTVGVYDTEGNIVAKSYSEFETYYPKPGWVEQDAEHWWNSVLDACRQAVKIARAGDQVEAISIANQRETVVPVGKDGEAISRAIVWQDRRCREEVGMITREMGEERLAEITGLKPDPYFTLPKILWWARNKPEILKKAWKLMLVHDYLVYRLTGEVVTDHSNASRTMLLDLTTRKWSDEIASVFSIDLDLMPDLRASGEYVGETRGNVAEKLGIRGRPSVIVGGGDQQCSALAQGVVEEGKVKSTTGTGTFMVAPVERISEFGEIIYSAHVIPDVNVGEVSIFTTGSLLSWIKRSFYHGEGYDVLNVEAERSGAGARGLFVLPFFSGAGCPHWNSEAKGLIGGLTLAHTRGDIARAVMEAVAFEVRTNIEVMERGGIVVEELRLDGGAANSRLWNQIFADVTGKRCLVSSDVEATARGAAILAAAGTENFSGIFDALNSFIPDFSEVLPDENGVRVYSEIYSEYVRVRNMYIGRC
ncbi:xylulokinase [Archaeoglobus neptunius]|uniref:xylulokinase n=1 Tax=Archaeoglobus neptunius TaxID=2798580 RepID=UPI0019289281|nr:FGGY family carbohydrate kinase [Archaeoglobus neptunius]